MIAEQAREMAAEKAVHEWLSRSRRRLAIMRNLTQPVTVRQLVHRCELSLDSGRKALQQLVERGLVRCLNPRARQSRVHWTTKKGEVWRTRLQTDGSKIDGATVAGVNWEHYGSVCFRHRTALICALVQPMTSAQVRQRALLRDPALRINRNNAREVLAALVGRGVVRRLPGRRRQGIRFALTEQGRTYRELLLGAWYPPSGL